VEINSITIGLGALISLLSGIIGAVGFWYKVKNKVDLLEVKQDSINKDHAELKTTAEKADDIIHNRIENLKQQVESNRARHDESITELKSEMSQMELRIIQAIHELKIK
jgi:hypothetical protein